MENINNVSRIVVKANTYFENGYNLAKIVQAKNE
jgi:hypothetical protein